jgi:hypothetical protein
MATVWKIAPGEGAYFWEDCRDRGCITINWLNRHDLSQFEDKAEITRALLKVDQREGSRGAASIWPFVNEIGRGDVVVANNGLSQVEGVGIVTSGYLHPDHVHNPNRYQDHHRHARRVDWLIKERVDLGTQLFNRPTVQKLGPDECHKIRNAYLRQNRSLKDRLDELFDPSSRGKEPAADESESPDDGEYEASKGDQREAAWRLIKKRRGQPQFRRALMHRYRARCLVTGCTVADVLEAAHIDPYRSENNNHPGNGLLLRADIHTLFDLNLLGIEPASLRVELHSDIAKTYEKIVRKSLFCTDECRPLLEVLKRRYKEFKERLKSPT